MDKETQFINSIFVKPGAFDFVVCLCDVNVEEFKAFLDKNKDYIEKNKGQIRLEILRTKADRDKYYMKFTPFEPKPQVEATEHLPDREKNGDDDLPF